MGVSAEIRWLGSTGGGAVQVAGLGQCRLRSVQVEEAVAGVRGAGFRWGLFQGKLVSGGAAAEVR